MSKPLISVAKIQTKGQLTLPRDVRKQLHLDIGDRVVLICEGDRLILMNADTHATHMLQQIAAEESEDSDIGSPQEAPVARSLKVAVIGSRSLTVPNLANYLPAETEEIVSGGARGVDSSAREYARRYGLKLKEFLPDYGKYGKGAPIRRNDEIIQYADRVLAFWDGESRGTKYVIQECERRGIPVEVILP